MATLLVIIYIAFISLGLPDSVLGGAWPVMRADLGAPVQMAGYLAMVISAGTVVSSLMSNRLTSRFGTGKVTVASVLMTALALMGFALAPSAWILFLLAIPMGLGAGSVDAALNNFVALHFAARHMNWLHCFWGIGATAGPMILTAQLAAGNGWRGGYWVIAIIQGALTVALFITLPLWRKNQGMAQSDDVETAYITNREALRLPGIGMALAAFVFFCAVELTGGLWGASYLSDTLGMTAIEASRVSSLYYGAITVGRLISGFVSQKLNDTQLIRAGQILCILGALITIFAHSAQVAMWSIALIGLGTAPIYPAMLHETPRRFGAQNSQAVIGLEMAFAYVGNVCFPSLFGALAGWTSTALYPWFLLICAAAMWACSEGVQRQMHRRDGNQLANFS